MEDKEIIELYLARNESAIEATEARYGDFSRKISYRILNSIEDAEECVDDAYLKLWETIPPTIPESLQAYLGRIVRNISISLLRWKTRRKRSNGTNVLLSELSECIPSANNVEKEAERKYLSELITEWLESEKKENRQIFVRRYWYGSSYEEMTRIFGIPEKKLTDRLYRMRGRLKEFLEGKGVSV